MRLLRQLSENRGQGVFELVVILGLIAAMAVATPAYLRLQSQRANKAAQNDLVAAARAADSYRRSHGSFRGMTNLELIRQSSDASETSIVWVRRSAYCLAATKRGQTWSLRGPYKSKPHFLSSADCT